MACNHNEHSRSYCDCANEIDGLIAARTLNNGCGCGCGNMNFSANGRRGYVQVTSAFNRQSGIDCRCRPWGCGPCPACCNCNCGCGCGCGGNQPTPCVEPLRITSPVAGSFVEPPVLVSGTAPQGRQLNLLLDDVSIGSAYVDCSGSWSHVISSILPGAHVITAIDPEDCERSTSVTFWVPNAPEI